MVKKRLLELSLDEDVLYGIFNKCSLRDTIRMGAVCKSWRSVSKWSTTTRHQLPWLMMLWDPKSRGMTAGLATSINEDRAEEKEKEMEFRCFFTLSDNTMYGPIKFVGLDGKRCCGSFSNADARGWLMTIFDGNGDMQLFHPWHGIQLQLPNHSTLPCGRFTLPCGRFSSWSYPPVRRMIRSRAAMSDDASTVAVIADLSCELVFCTIGDEVWTRVEDNYNERYGDVIYHKGQFYVVTRNGRVGVVRTNTTNPYIETLTEPILDDRFETYLVGDSTSGSLFILKRVKKSLTDFKRSRPPWTIGFQVYELRLEETGEYIRKPLEVDSLGDRVIFLGRNSSMLIMGSQFPGFQVNRIYFTDMLLESIWPIPFDYMDIGIFNVEDKTVRRPPDLLNRAIHRFSPPIWISPCPAL